MMTAEWTTLMIKMMKGMMMVVVVLMAMVKMRMKKMREIRRKMVRAMTIENEMAILMVTIWSKLFKTQAQHRK